MFYGSIIIDQTEVGMVIVKIIIDHICLQFDNEFCRVIIGLDVLNGIIIMSGPKLLLCYKMQVDGQLLPWEIMN